MKESYIIDAINAYSRLGEGHPFRDYGNNIKISVNDDCTIYRCRVRTQYEKRSLQKSSVPYTGGKLPPQTVMSDESADPWGFKLASVDAFTNNIWQERIAGSTYVTTCLTCGGNAIKTCPACGGAAKKTCPVCHGDYTRLTCEACNGTGFLLCPTCGGEREITCKNCNGHGTLYKKRTVKKQVYDYTRKMLVLQDVEENYSQQCPECKGRGRWRCPTCGGNTIKRGYVTCKTCHNMGFVMCTNCTEGYVLCKTCSGEGKITCTTCNGHGKMERFLKASRNLRYESLVSYICDQRLKGFAAGYDFSSSKPVFSQRKNSLESGLYPENPQCGEELDRLVARSCGKDKEKTLFQDASVHQVQATFVRYRYESKDYSGIVCDGKFHPSGSPIDDWTGNLISSASKKIKWGNAIATLKDLYKAEAAGCAPKDIKSLRSRAFDKIDRIHAAGVSAAAWIMVAASSPVLYNFYDKLNPVAPWAIVTNNPNWRFFNFLPFCQTLIFLLLLLVIRALFSAVSESAHEKIEKYADGTLVLYERNKLLSESARMKKLGSMGGYFAKGFLGYLAAAVGAFVFIVLTGYLGISIVTTFAIGWVVAIASIVIALACMLIKWIIGLFA